MRVSLSTFAVSATQARVIDPVPVFLRVDLSVSLVCKVIVCFSKICRLRSVHRLLRLPFSLDRLIALPSLAMEAASIYIVELVSMCFRINFDVCLESIVAMKDVLAIQGA